MTDTRLDALEAVAEKAAAFHQSMLAPIGSMKEGYLARAREELEDAFSALNALPAQPAGETVDVQAHVRLSNDGGAYIVSGMGALNGNWTEPRPGGAFATLTARVPLPAVPSVTANVEVTP